MLGLRRDTLLISQFRMPWFFYNGLPIVASLSERLKLHYTCHRPLRQCIHLPIVTKQLTTLVLGRFQ